MGMRTASGGSGKKELSAKLMPKRAGTAWREAASFIAQA
jgi:hypothetical protein